MSQIKLFKLEFEKLIEDDVDSAIEYCIKSLENSNDSDIYLCLGEALMAQENFEEALIYIDKAINGICSNKVLAYSLQGECLFYLNMYNESKEAFYEVLKLEKMSFFANVYIIDISIHEGNYLEAIDIINKLICYGKYDIEDIAFLETKKGWIMFKYLEKQEESFKLFKSSLEKDCTCGTAYVGSAYYFLFKKDYKEAITNFNMAIDLGEAYDIVYEGLRLAKEREGDTCG